MLNLDPIISSMKVQECKNCHCEEAIYDETKEKVNIKGSFCNVISGHDQIHILATNLETGEEVYNKICDTGKTCSIPFTSMYGFVCE